MCSGGSGWRLCVMSGFEWHSLDTTHFMVESLSFAAVLLDFAQFSSATIETDVPVNERVLF